MKKFYYERLKEMPPRRGNKFGTIYYKQSVQQKQVLTDFVKSVKELVDLDIDTHNNYTEWNKPDPHFKRRGNIPPYSAYQIVNDLNDQLQANKDATKGLVGRWQRLFDGTEYTFDLIDIEDK